jgi:hypothetical protein
VKNYLIAAFVVAFCTATFAASKDCPTPTPPTCEQRIARAKAAGCKLESDSAHLQLECADCPTCPPPVPPKTVKVPGPTVYQDVPYPVHDTPKGHGLFGGGPVYFHGLGATLVGGYEFAGKTATSGHLQLLAGPFYVPQNGQPASSGSVHGCAEGPSRHQGGGDDDDCGNFPYTVPAVPEKDSLGGQFLAIWAF